MFTSFQYGDVSPARYPDFESKRKRRGSTPSAYRGGKKKKKSKKKKETVIPSSSPPEGSIQEMVRVGLDAFAKDNVVVEERDPLTVLQEYRDQGNVTVLQEGVSVPQPTQDQETQTALQELIQELIEPPPPPVMPDYLVCPYHICHLEPRVSQNGWHYVKCPMFPCVLFCAEEKAGPYMRAVHEQVHSDILKMWKHLLCFCCQHPVLQQSRSEKNPDRMFLTCSKKKCKFFQWGNHPLRNKYKDWLEQEPGPPVHRPTSTRDADGYPLYGVDVAGPPPPPRPRFERGVDPSVKKASVVDGLERRLDASLNTKVPRPVTEYEKQLIEEIRRLKEDATPPPPSRFERGFDPILKEALETNVLVPDRPLSEQERLRVEEVRQLKKGIVSGERKVGWHNF